MICVRSLIKKIPNVHVGVMHLWSGPHATSKLVYGNKATSTLGSAVSYTGPSGTFKLSGTIAIKSTASESFTTVPVGGKRILKTDFQYAEWALACGGTVTYLVEADRWEGGADYANITTTPSATHCVVQRAGSGFTKSDTRSTTYSDDVKLGTEIGLNLSASTGFESSAKVTFAFSSDGQLCGTRNAPADSPGRLVGK